MKILILIIVFAGLIGLVKWTGSTLNIITYEDYLEDQEHNRYRT